MLESLRVSNFALIESAELEFSRGFTAITGETGAGKSVLLGALRTVLGERAGGDLVRAGAKKAIIEAVFRGPFPPAVGALLDAGGFQPEDDEDREILILRRDLQTGATRNLINGQAATASQLREIASHLVDMHAQHENARLFSPAEQLALLDTFGDCEEARTKYARHWAALAAARERLEATRRRLAEGERRADYLRFQTEELERAAIEPGEDAHLEAERRRLAHSERLAHAAAEAADLLLEGERSGAAAADLLRQAARLAAEVASLDPDQEPLAADAEQLRYAVADLGERLRDYAAANGGDPQRLQQTEDRLALLRQLKRKHQAESADALIELFEAMSAELQQIDQAEWEVEALEKEVQAALAAARAAAATLSRLRAEAATDFQTLVEAEMAELELPGARLIAQLLPRKPDDAELPADDDMSQPAIAGLGPDGAETIEFLVTLNPGSPPLPLRKVASGGEVARIMLAIKCVLATSDEVPTLVFDEIDVGISGQAAARVGEKLASLADHHQLLCITHLPQVAARGTAQLLVEKHANGDTTRSTVRPLTPQQREEALAKMLGGSRPNQEARNYANRLLQEAANARGA